MRFPPHLIFGPHILNSFSQSQDIRTQGLDAPLMTRKLYSIKVFSSLQTRCEFIISKIISDPSSLCTEFKELSSGTFSFPAKVMEHLVFCTFVISLVWTFFLWENPSKTHIDASWYVYQRPHAHVGLEMSYGPHLGLL